MESYLPIPGHPGYEVSDLGNVRNSKTGRVLKPNVIRGYRYVHLQRHGKGALRGIHRLVLLAHVGPPPTDKHHGAHRDGTRSNNTLGNLRWATAAENEADKVAHGTVAKGDRNGALTKLTKADVRAIRIDTRTHQTVADSLGVSRSTVAKIRQRKNWSHVQ